MFYDTQTSMQRMWVIRWGISNENNIFVELIKGKDVTQMELCIEIICAEMRGGMYCSVCSCDCGEFSTCVSVT